ncbi:MAG: hypothetical protein IJU19_03945 [Bacteroidales bacterium]|nr:hypothetical protein [Bacteroidales bacterium]
MAIGKKTKWVAVALGAAVVVGLLVWGYVHFFFVYSTGNNAGELNYFQKEGLVFKTYEGKMIQNGFRSSGGQVNGLRSNEFKFSVTDSKVAERLMRCSGKTVELKWKRYLGALPWRGNSQYVVVEVLSVE